MELTESELETLQEVLERVRQTVGNKTAYGWAGIFAWLVLDEAFTPEAQRLMNELPAGSYRRELNASISNYTQLQFEI